jgi:hypothetical protein
MREIVKIITEYRQDENKGYAYRNDVLVATLDFDTDVFEEDCEMTQEEYLYYEDLMQKDKLYYEDNKNYDVRAEQGLFGYGY